MSEMLQAVGSIVLGLAVIAWLVVWIWALQDAGRYTDEEWRAAGESKTTWFLLILVLQFFGTLFYLLSVRPKLLAVGER